MVGNLLMQGLIIYGLEDFLVISERLTILMTVWDSNEVYISKCIISNLTFVHISSFLFVFYFVNVLADHHGLFLLDWEKNITVTTLLT